MATNSSEERAKTAAGTVAPDARDADVLEQVTQLNASLKASRVGWDSHWQSLANYVQPRKAHITESQQIATPQAEKEMELFDSTAVQANMILASGHMQWMTPAESIWFSYGAPQQFQDDDEVKGWFHAVSIIAAQELARSNFYTNIHESYLNRGGFGTASVFVGTNKKGGLFFRDEEVGTFSIAEDSEGNVDTFIREFTFTAQQAVQEYGEDAMHPNSMKDYRTDVKCRQKEINFIHAIYPRMERDKNNPGAEHMPIASVTVDMTHKHVVRKGGFRDMPNATTRYLKWGRSAYGWSPAWVALPEMRQVNFLEKNLDLLSELKLFPRLLLPASMRGKVDLRPGGITYTKQGLTADEMPREWATVGDVKEGMLRAEAKRKAIKEAFHVDLFQMFAQMEPKQMTAREVSERASEKLIQFSPTFSRSVNEYYTPILRRSFVMLYNMGKFPEPPRQLFQYLGGRWLLAEPEIAYNSRVALAMAQTQNVSFLRTLDALAPIAQIRPGLLDHYDWNTIVRDLNRNEGTPESWILPAQEVQAMQQAQQEAMRKMEEAQVAEQIGGTIAKMGSVKPGSQMDQVMRRMTAGGMPGMPALG